MNCSPFRLVWIQDSRYDFSLHFSSWRQRPPLLQPLFCCSLSWQHQTHQNLYHQTNRRQRKSRQPTKISGLRGNASRRVKDIQQQRLAQLLQLKMNWLAFLRSLVFHEILILCSGGSWMLHVFQLYVRLQSVIWRHLPLAFPVNISSALLAVPFLTTERALAPTIWKDWSFLKLTLHFQDEFWFVSDTGKWQPQHDDADWVTE